MKYIVNELTVTRDIFYFCKKAKEENKTFVLVDANTYVDGYINKYPEYDYYIRDEIKIYYTKGKANVKKWFDKYIGNTYWFADKFLGALKLDEKQEEEE